MLGTLGEEIDVIEHPLRRFGQKYVSDYGTLKYVCRFQSYLFWPIHALLPLEATFLLGCVSYALDANT